MSIFLKRAIEQNGQIGIWKIEEEAQFFKHQSFFSVDFATILEKKHPKHQLEWLASRHLLYEMSGGKVCETDDLGKPFFKNSSLHLSISHSGALAAVVLHGQEVGVDVQKITPKIKKIAHKFLRAEEKNCLQAANFLEHLHVFWGGKEALYKAYGKKGLDFRAHIFMQPFVYSDQGGTLKGSVIKDDYNQNFTLTYEKIEDYILVYAIADAENVSF